jgi:hypothetical protein
VLGVSILPLSTFLIFDFGIVPTVWYFYFLFVIGKAVTYVEGTGFKLLPIAN